MSQLRNSVRVFAASNGAKDLSLREPPGITRAARIRPRDSGSISGTRSSRFVEEGAAVRSITHKESGISDTDPGESFAESEVPGTGTEAFSGVCASKVLLNCSLGAVSGAIPDVRAAIESLSFFSIISPTFWVKYSRRDENAGCGSGSLDSGIEDPRVEVLEIIVEGGSLLSSTKGLFKFNPEARSSEVGEGDDILVASWRELRDEEKK